MENEIEAQVVNDHGGPYDLWARGVQAIDSEPAPDNDQPHAVRGGVRFHRATRQEWLDRAQARLQDNLDSASMVRVRLYIGELSAEIGEFDTRQGGADLAALLRQVADRLDQ